MPHGVVNPLGALDQSGKNVIEVIDREGVVQPQSIGRGLGPKPVAVPQLHLRVPLPTEQHYLPLTTTGYQYQYGIGFFEAGEVKQVAVLAKRVFRISASRDFTRTRDDRDAVSVHHRHEIFAAADKFSFGDFHCSFPVVIALR